MFRECDWISHEEHMAFILDKEREFNKRTGHSLFEESTDKMLVIQLAYYNLDRIKPLLLSLFDEGQGRPAENLQKVMWSCFLYVAGRKYLRMPLDTWFEKVKEKRLYYTLIGCNKPDEVPGVGSYYDLMNRFWMGDRIRYSREVMYDARRNSRKGKMEVGEDNKIKDKDYKAEDMKQAYLANLPLSRNSDRISQQLVTFMAVYPSMENGCIPPVRVGAIDSTAVQENASRFGHAACGHKRLDCQSRQLCGMNACFACPDGSMGFLFC